MSRQAVRIVILLILATVSWYFGKPQASAPASDKHTLDDRRWSNSYAHLTWGRIETLPDHFERHGKDFNARVPEEYAYLAAEFLKHGKEVGLPAKRDSDGSLRIYERATNTFGVYNADGKTKTFFKPEGPSYFDRQPGEPVDLRTMR